MKKLLLLSLFMFSAIAVINAQYWQIPNPNANTNPNALNTDDEYPSGSGLPTGWSTILSGSNTSPNWSAAQTIPFSFSFNGAPATSYIVSSSGVLTFDVATSLAAPSYTKAALPNASIPNNSICIWGMNGSGSNDLIMTKVFGTTPNRQLWIHFNSYGYNTTMSDGSNFTYWSIVLEEGSNNIYIVDQRTGGFANTNKVSAGIQINNTTAYSVATSPDLLSLATTDPSPADNSYYTFIYGTQPAYDVQGLQVATEDFVVQGNVALAAKLRNLGSTTITSLTLNYTVDGGSTVSAPITGLNIAPLATTTITHTTPWNASALGAHTINIWASNLNVSNADANTSNDMATKMVSVLVEKVTRLPLLEVFTSSTCAPCKPGNENLHSIIDTIDKNNYVVVKFQQDFPGNGDPYRTVESVNRRNFYAINSIPRMEIDGGWDGNASSFSYPLYTGSRAIPAQFKMDGTYKLNNKSMDMNVKFSPLAQISGAKLYVAIIESLTTQNVASNGETQFTSVMKKMIPNENGTAISSSITPGVWDSLSFTYTFNGNYRLPANGLAANIINHTVEPSVENFNNLKVIAWVQGSNKNVYQAVNLKNLTPEATEDFSKNFSNISVSPNPATSLINLDFTTDQSEDLFYTVIDATGNVVLSKDLKSLAGKNHIQIDLSSMASGIYHIMMFDSHQNAHIEKVVLSH
ncbi:MAG: T9SS type A sorting domain-containing protein [Chitinophagaceae bacterium]